MLKASRLALIVVLIALGSVTTYLLGVNKGFDLGFKNGLATGTMMGWNGTFTHNGKSEHPYCEGTGGKCNL